MMNQCKKGKLCIELCKLMGWRKKEAWNVWNSVLSKKKLEDIIEKLTELQDLEEWERDRGD